MADFAQSRSSSGAGAVFFGRCSATFSFLPKGRAGSSSSLLFRVISLNIDSKPFTRNASRFLSRYPMMLLFPIQWVNFTKRQIMHVSQADMSEYTSTISI